MKIYLNSIVVAVVTFVYASSMWLGESAEIVSTSYQRPFVYRQLVPFLVRFLDNFLPVDYTIILIVTLTGVGLYLALQSLAKFLGIENELGVLIVVLAGLALFSSYRKPYDLMTGLLWTLAILFIMQGEYKKFTALFVLVCFNRIDTASILLLVWAIFNFWRWEWVCANITIYILTFLGLRLLFMDNAGAEMWIEPIKNLQALFSFPMLLLHLALSGIVLWLVFRNWERKSVLMRWVFLLLTPIFLVLYVVFGQAAEIRVFWELVPVVAVLVLS